MKSSKQIDPKQVTKPIQLLAAWLVGLIIVDSAFLTAASTITTPSWVPSLLVIAAVANVPIFLIALFVLQTRFRPEMQEDTFYSQYLLSKLGESNKENSISLSEKFKDEIIQSSNQSLDTIKEIQSYIKSFPDPSTLDSVKEDEIAGQSESRASILLKMIEKVNIDIEKVTQKSEWGNLAILMNDNLPDSQNIRQSLQKYGIPINDRFGGEDHIPPDRVVAFGRGLQIEHIRKIINALSTSEINWVNFAQDEEQPGQYDNLVLIGSYGGAPEKDSVAMKEAKAFLELSDVTTKDFYQFIFDASFGDGEDA